jgi:hypothetical protein
MLDNKRNFYKDSDYDFFNTVRVAGPVVNPAIKFTVLVI